MFIPPHSTVEELKLGSSKRVTYVPDIPEKLKVLSLTSIQISEYTLDQISKLIVN